MLVLVCGSRGWRDGDAIRKRLRALPPDTRFIMGGASGADRMAENVARLLFGRKSMRIFLPDWDTHGKHAGLVRNKRMLEEKPDLVLAFWDGVSTGTAYTLEHARRMGIKTEVVRP